MHPRLRAVGRHPELKQDPKEPERGNQRQAVMEDSNDLRNLFKKQELGTRKVAPPEQKLLPFPILFKFPKYIMYNKVLGEGSFSTVYLGQIRSTKQSVAIKQVRELEQNEIACLINTQSEHIIKMYDFWTCNKQSYIVLELCDRNLKEEIEGEGTAEKRDLEKLLSYFEQIVDGMDHLYRKSIIHRDLKFENIMIKDGKVKISDFGFAKPIGNSLAVFSERCGTPYTMAPEIFFHNSNRSKPVYTHKCDIYSLGVILHELLYQLHPFDMCANRMRGNLRVEIPNRLKEDRHSYLDMLIDRCLETEVTKRCNWQEFLQIFTLHKMKCSEFKPKNQPSKQAQKIQPTRIRPQVVRPPLKTNMDNLKKRQINVLRPANREASLKGGKFKTPKKKKRVKTQYQAYDYFAKHQKQQQQKAFQKEDPFQHLQISSPQQRHKCKPNLRPDRHKDIPVRNYQPLWSDGEDWQIGPSEKTSANEITEQTVATVTRIVAMMMLLLLGMLFIGPTSKE